MKINCTAKVKNHLATLSQNQMIFLRGITVCQRASEIRIRNCSEDEATELHSLHTAAALSFLFYRTPWCKNYHFGWKCSLQMLIGCTRCLTSKKKKKKPPFGVKQQTYFK